MTRINTNVSSLQAQINLSRNNEDLQTALTRLSTGLRINSGKDDPAGLIASETLRSDIRATEVGISNSERANQMIATADSALGQVSSLLIDIRGLVDEAANSGAMSAEQIAANQLQVDASLDAIDRISQITQFQGSRLLDGSLAFTSEGVDSTKLDSVQIDQANFGTNPTIGVNVELLAQATKGSLVYESGETTSDVVLQVGGTEGFQAFSFDAGTSVTDMASAINLVSDATGVTAVSSGVIEWEASAAMSTVASYGTNNDITITANTASEAAGAYYIRYFDAGGVGTATSATVTQAEVDATTGAITYGYIDVSLGTAGTTAAVFTDLTSGVPAQDLAAGTIDMTASGAAQTLNWDANAGEEGVIGAPVIDITVSAGGSDTATYDASNQTYTVSISAATSTTSAVQDLLNNAVGSQFTFSGGDGTAVDTTATGGSSISGAVVTAGINGAEAAFELNATAITPGAASNDAYSIEFTNSNGGAASYNATTNVYTVDIDNDAGVYSMSSTDLIGLLNVVGNREHDFDIGTSGGTEVVNAGVQGGDWTMVTNAASTAAITTAGSDGGEIGATGNDVIDAINTAQDALGLGSRLFAVENAAGNDGTGVTAISEVMALTGSDSGQQPDANNMLQYQALDGMRDVRYVVSGQSTSLSIDLNSYEPEYAHASTIIDLGLANGTFQLSAVAEGEAGNMDVSITWAVSADGDDHISWDGTTLAIEVADDDLTTLDDIMTLINSDAATTGIFSATPAKAAADPSGIPDVGDPTLAILTGAVVGALTSPDNVSLTGGVVSNGVMVVNLATDENGVVTTTANDLISFVEASSEQIFTDFQLQITNGGNSAGTGLLSATTADVKFDPAGTTYVNTFASGSTHAANGSTAQFTVTAKTAGTAYDDVLVRVVNDTNLTTGTGAVTFLEDSNTLLISYNGNYTAEQVSQLINTDDTVGAIFNAVATAGIGNGSGNVADGDFVRLSGGETRTVPDPTSYTPSLPAGNPMLNLIGGQDAGQDISDAMLTFSASNYGTKSFVSVEAISGMFSVMDPAGAVADRSYGTDVSVRINGLQAIGDGLNASLSTSSLQMQIGIDVNMIATQTTSFSITGGGAQFQLGPDVVSNQQARIGIMSLSTATLGGINNHGRLFEIRSGENHDLSTDTTGAAAIVQDVIGQVTGLRGRLGAFQKTTLETNIYSLQDTLETLTAAESSIRDADFAAESSALTRAQILVQSGTRVLSIANQQPQSVLSLIQ